MNLMINKIHLMWGFFVVFFFVCHNFCRMQAKGREPTFYTRINIKLVSLWKYSLTILHLDICPKKINKCRNMLRARLLFIEAYL